MVIVDKNKENNINRVEVSYDPAQKEDVIRRIKAYEILFEKMLEFFENADKETLAKLNANSWTYRDGSVLYRFYEEFSEDYGNINGNKKTAKKGYYFNLSRKGGNRLASIIFPGNIGFRYQTSEGDEETFFEFEFDNYMRTGEQLITGSYTNKQVEPANFQFECSVLSYRSLKDTEPLIRFSIERQNYWFELYRQAFENFQKEFYKKTPTCNL